MTDEQAPLVGKEEKRMIDRSPMPAREEGEREE